MKKDLRKIVKCRNEASIILDDLIVLIRNGTLAGALRLFSGQIMELKPGFAFTLKQARALKSLTGKILRQYKAHRIGDEELMDYQSKARMILQGKEQSNGGTKMGITGKFDRLIHRQEIKQQESVDTIQQQYYSLWNQIQTCEQEMNRCVNESKNLAPDSMKYRDNERNYVANKNMLIMLYKQLENLSGFLDEVARRKAIKQMSDIQDIINKATNVVLRNTKDIQRRVANIEVGSDAFKNALEDSREQGADLFRKEVSSPKTDSEFGALVAKEARRQAALENAGMSHEEIEQIDAEAQNEFAALIDAAEKEEK